jgi:hypothetical protein
MTSKTGSFLHCGEDTEELGPGGKLTVVKSALVIAVILFCGCNGSDFLMVCKCSFEF